MVLLFHRELNSRYPELETKAILYHLFDNFMGWSRATLHLNREKFLTEEIELRFLNALGRLRAGEPIQYIIGRMEFCGLNLKIQPGVLIPRPETEELAVLVTRDNQRFRNQTISILDIGTGSGCLALSMKKAFPSANVTGIDKSPDALEIARQNALSNQLEVTFFEDDILNPSFSWSPVFFDIIISNPPYIPEQERATMSSHVVDYEPENALFVANDNPLLYYDAIAGFAKTNLTPDGLLYVEIHENYGDATVNLFHDQGFRSVEMFLDYFGKNRFIRVSTPS